MELARALQVLQDRDALKKSANLSPVVSIVKCFFYFFQLSN